MKQFLLSFICISCYFFLGAQDVHELARTGTVDQMKDYLVKDSMAINRLNDRGISPFVLACYRGNNDVAKFLLDKGANVTHCAAEGSALYGMVFKNNIEMLEYFLSKGYSPDDTCQFQQFGTALHMAMSLKRYEIIDTLLKYKASLSIKDPQGRDIKSLTLFYNDEKLTRIIKKYEKD